MRGIGQTNAGSEKMGSGEVHGLCNVAPLFLISVFSNTRFTNRSNGWWVEDEFGEKQNVAKEKFSF